jgi:ArsR family transcriptional regulator, lead/cadmium/zinc/bismuth-responsive transcriptional repressor
MSKTSAIGLTPDETIELAEMLHIMGDPNRLGILLGCLEDEQSVGALAKSLGLTQSLVSHHLRLLRAARLVRGRRQGKQVFYSAADVHVRSVLHDLIAHVIEPKAHEDH